MAYPTSSSSERDLTTNPEGTRLYNPYQDLQLPSRRLYSLPTSPEFLFAEEAQIQRRSWGENLTYYTGISYLSGSTLGASQGLYSALKATESDDTLKLRINRILNSSGHSGRKMGNRIGCIGLIYAGLESGVVAVRDKDDVFSSLAAGLGTGVIYKAAAGLRSAAVGGAVGSVVAGILVAGKQVTKRYVPI